MKEFLNLQLFADPNTNTTTDASTGNNLAPEMKTYYDMTLIDEAKPNLVHDQFGQKRPIPRGNGKTIEFRKFASLPKALTPLTEGVTPDGGNLDVSNITATIAQYGYYVTQSDLLELTAIDNTIVEATKLLGTQAGKTLDTVTRDILNAGTSKYLCPTRSGSTETEVTLRSKLDGTSVLTVKDVQRIATILKAANAPTINGNYVAIIHPYNSYTLMRDPEWVDAHKYAKPEEIYAGEIGRIAGVRFVESTEAKIWHGDDLASDSRTLKVNNVGGYSGAITSIAFDSGTVVADALIGRYIIINGIKAKVTDNTSSALTIESTNFGSITDNTVIYPGEGASDGSAVFSTLFLGANAYGVTELAGGGLEMFAKQKGSAGTADPLNQRSTIGWKAAKTAEILVQAYMVRCESTCPDFAEVPAN